MKPSKNRPNKERHGSAPSPILMSLNAIKICCFLDKNKGHVSFYTYPFYVGV